MKKDAISDHRPDELYNIRTTEVAYHKVLNPLVAIFGAVIFLCFTIFFYFVENYFQTFIFFLMFADAAGALLLTHRVKSEENLIRLKVIGTAIAFFLWAISLVAGILSDDNYIFFPWIFVYPIAFMFMFGRRIGSYATVLFCILITVMVAMARLPVWDQSKLNLLKLNSAFALFVLSGLASFSEKARLRVQKKLVAAQNKSRIAEQRQREINLELEQEIQLRKQSEHALAQSEIRYRAFFEESAVSIWEEDWSRLKQHIDEHADEIGEDIASYLKNNSEVLDSLKDLICVNAVNQATLSLYQADSRETLLKNVARILPEPYIDYIVDRLTALSRSGRYQAEVTSQTINGRPLYLLVSSSIPVGFESSWGRIYTTVFDNTERVLMAAERRRVRRQLQSAREIQAVATLAGGIAHKFNNALAIIVLNLDLLEIRLQGDGSLSKILTPLRASARKIGQLTEQLLAYAQGGKYQPKQFSVNELIRDLLAEEKMAPQPSVKVITVFDTDICAVNGDITQIKMVMQAVICNAFESIADSGTVIIETGNRIIDAGKTEEKMELPSGKYATISVGDDGVGMDGKTLERIFEPFFTTKVFGRGLGMAAAYGIVKNHSGIITVESLPGRGSTVKIYLPEDRA